MTIYKTYSGSYVIERRVNDKKGGYIFTMNYIGYTLKEAKVKFRADYTNHISNKLQY